MRLINNQEAEQVMKDNMVADKEKVAKFIDAMMKQRRGPNKEVADRMGYNSPTIIQMFRDGRAKVSLEEIPDLADAIGADRADLLERALREYLPNIVEVLLRCHSGLTDNELAIVHLVRELAEGNDPDPHEPGLKSRLQQAFKVATPASK